MAQPIYNEIDVYDEISISTQIEEFCTALGMKDIRVDTPVLQSVISGMKADFPYEYGHEEASAFKKVANFLCFFIATKPIRSVIPESCGKLAEFDVNCVVGLDIAINALHGAKIISKNGDEKEIKNPLEISDHSYFDILEMLQKVTPSSHFHVIAILLEQITYKTNKNCQYTVFAYE